MNLEVGHWPTEAAKKSSVASGFSLAARQDLLLDSRQDLRFSAVQTCDTKCFLFIFSPFLFAVYIMKGWSRHEYHSTTASEIRDFGERIGRRTSYASGFYT